ncbi:MAG: hypothetical protein LBT90_00405 [Holosporaceae bacterium]|nr:hypothetical protein [Holosporaceae bacterium]
MPDEIFLARVRKNAAQDHRVLCVHEDLSSGSDEVCCEKKPLGNDLEVAELQKPLNKSSATDAVAVPEIAAKAQRPTSNTTIAPRAPAKHQPSADKITVIHD